MAKDDRIDLLRKALVELKAKAPEQGRAQVDVESLEKWIAARSSNQSAAERTRKSSVR